MHCFAKMVEVSGTKDVIGIILFMDGFNQWRKVTGMGYLAILCGFS
jgi:hypothetical protein